jgi:anaerobic selenocysteine-containing dehydrogenase
MSRADADARAIRDGDMGRVWNELGALQAQVKVVDSVRPGQLIVDHAWEPFQFKDGSSHQAIIGSPINPITLAGGYFHLQPTPISGEAGTNDRATRCEVERVA